MVCSVHLAAEGDQNTERNATENLIHGLNIFFHQFKVISRSKIFLKALREFSFPTLSALNNLVIPHSFLCPYKATKYFGYIIHFYHQCRHPRIHTHTQNKRPISIQTSIVLL